VTELWRRYLLAGLVASAICVSLPAGIGRDIVYCLIGFSSVAAILTGIRRSRTTHPTPWYLFAAGTTAWALADGLYGWYGHVALTAPFPSLADALYLAAYSLFASGLVILSRRRNDRPGPTGLDETAIVTVGMALLAWVFLIAPTWTDYQEPLVNRLVSIAYPFFDVLLFALLMRLSASGRARNTSFLLVSGSVGALVVSDVTFAAGAFVPAMAAPTFLLDFGWLLSYVLWGAAALHPSMREVSSPPPPRTLRFSTARLTLLAGAVLIGPAVLACELMAGHPPDVGPVAVAGGVMVTLTIIGVRRMMRLLDNQANRLRELADTDFVTGLVNRRYFVARLDELLQDAHPEVTGLLLVDLERFAEINDTLGQRTADDVLRTVGARLGELTGERAVVARMGNDLFGILDPSITSGDESCRAAKRIRQALEGPLELPDLSVSVEVSVGAVVLPEDGAEPELALMRADVALSVARASSERTARYGIEMESGAALAQLVIGDLREAIDNGEIIVHYQPQVEVRSGRVLGVEALVRWQHPRHGLLGPDTFIPSAEQTGLIGPLMQNVLDCSLRQCARWQRDGLDLTVAVNLSVRNLLDPGLVDRVRSALRRHGVDPRSLELEITESSAMVNPRRSIEVLGALRELGVELSVDDYGTGHSSLSYLQELPVGRLKIDRSFVTGMINDRASAAIVVSTIRLARVLRLDVVAEGVEDDATLLRLREMKCSTAQGFALGPPVTASLLPDLVRRLEGRLATVLGNPDLSAVHPSR
jgi:diguanylate cyclase (GGDEF)-like protein